MTTPTYDQTSPSSIERFGRRLVGNTLRSTPGVKFIPQEYMEATPGVQTKGHFGTIVERYYYGISPGNQPCSPDFKEAGVELKTNALEERKHGFSAKERLVFQMIDYDEIIHESFETSCFMMKSRLIMLISSMYQSDRILVDADIVLARLVDFDKLSPTDQQIIREDWTKIAEKVRKGQAHQLSGSDTIYLEACTKGTNASQRVTQPIGNQLAKPRAFALKSGFVTSLVRGYLADNEQLAVSDASELMSDGFEAAILERFAPFLGLSVDQIESRFGLSLNDSAKGYRATLTRRMMGVATSKIAEFERAGISLKTILIDENGHPPESMSFPIFRYKGPGSIIEENWDGDQDEDMPEIRRLLEETRFLFAVFKKDGSSVKLLKVLFWSMSKDDIEAFVRPVWEHTFDAIQKGTLPDLPKSSFNEVCHVRPHARNREDTLPTPKNGHQVKKCFWLDRRYIQSQLAMLDAPST
mgnify:CR=1 FL=1